MEIKNPSQRASETYRIERKQKAPRAQGGKGLLSQSIHIQNLNNPWLESLTLERRGEGQGGGEGGRQEEGVLRLAAREKKERKRG